MKLQFSNVWATVVEATTVELEWLRAYLTCEDTRYNPQAKKQRNYSEPEVDPTYCMYDATTRSFPTGLLINMWRAALRDSIDLEAEDMRELVCDIGLSRDRVAWLRDYQWNAVEKFCRRGCRGLIKVPTSGGKTEIFIALTLVLACEWIFVVHRKTLVSQAAARYNLRTRETAGTFKAGVWKRGTSNVTVTTFQAISRAMTRPKKGFKPRQGCSVRDLLRETEALCVDEIHCQPAKSYYSVSMALENARIRIGLSGTPLDKSDRENLRTMGAIGPIVYEIAESLLVERGVLAKAETRMIVCEQWSAPDDGWRQVYETLIVHSQKRNGLLATIIARAAKPCLCFVEEVRHARNLSELVQRSGGTVDITYGPDSEATRKRKLSRLVNGEIRVLICTVIFQEGLDAPELKSVVVGGGKGKSSKVAAIQRRGRGTRMSAGKTSCEIWDVLDKCQWWLEDHADRRRAAYAYAGDDVQIGWPA